MAQLARMMFALIALLAILYAGIGPGEVFFAHPAAAIGAGLIGLSLVLASRRVSSHP